jgi:hypothetical protein
MTKKEYFKAYYQENKGLMKQVKFEIEKDKRLAHRELHRKLGTLRKTQKERKNDRTITNRT